MDVSFLCEELTEKETDYSEWENEICQYDKRGIIKKELW